MSIRLVETIGRVALLSFAVAAAGLASGGRPAAAQGLEGAKRDRAVALAKEIAADPAVVAAVKSQNAKHVPLDEIQKIDKAWMATKGIDDRMKALMESDCAKALKRMQASHREIAEAFVMDDQGANVCMTNKTSDYWQGDEAKWKESFKGGQGAVFVDKPAFDESAQAYVVQVSAPVMSGGRAIGAVTVGVNLELLAGK